MAELGAAIKERLPPIRQAAIKAGTMPDWYQYQSGR